MSQSRYPYTTISTQSNATYGPGSTSTNTGYEQEQQVTLHDGANEEYEYSSGVWSIDYSEGGDDDDDERRPMPIPEDTKIKISLNYDLDAKEGIYHTPPTMVVVEVDWTTTANRKKKERKPFVDISGYTNTFRSDPDFGTNLNLSSFMSSSHWSKKIDELYRSVDDNMSDFRKIPKRKYGRERHISESMELAVAEMLYSLETEKDKRGEDQIHIRILTTREAKGLRDNWGYSRWKRRDKIIIS
ncbi:uncharacterized protein L199_000315 [Kwoniella botswanensis]|uniref:uncharacterized protein n=1 Tax=Kwoniella botswanensis TaxID=1268659 RepID=UPI00315C96EE